MPKVANLKRQVRRNIERFEGGDFMFQLTKEECLRSQIVTLNETQGRHLKYMPYAFTMLGTARVPHPARCHQHRFGRALGFKVAKTIIRQTTPHRLHSAGREYGKEND